MNALTEALRSNTSLTSLELEGLPCYDITGFVVVVDTHLDTNDATSSAAALQVNTTLRTLSLRWNLLNKTTTPILARGLQDNCTLQTLVLDRDHFGDEVAFAIGRALATNTSLKMLELTYCDIRDDGVRALAEALKTKSTLQTLKLDGNFVDDLGAAALADGLQVNDSLLDLELSIDHNPIGDSGPSFLVNALTVITRRCCIFESSSVISMLKVAR